MNNENFLFLPYTHHSKTLAPNVTIKDIFSQSPNIQTLHMRSVWTLDIREGRYYRELSVIGNDWQTHFQDAVLGVGSLVQHYVQNGCKTACLCTVMPCCASPLVQQSCITILTSDKHSKNFLKRAA